MSQEDRPPLSSGAEELAKALANATPVAVRAASSNTRTQPALRQRPGGSDGGSVGGHEARPAAHRARSSAPAADGAEAQGVLERLQRLQALQSEAAQLFVP